MYFVFVLCILYLYAVESFGKFGCSLLTTTHAINALFRHHNQLASVMPTLDKDFSLVHSILSGMQNAVHITYYMDSTMLMVWSLALVILLRLCPGDISRVLTNLNNQCVNILFDANVYIVPTYIPAGALSMFSRRYSIRGVYQEILSLGQYFLLHSLDLPCRQ